MEPCCRKGWTTTCQMTTVRETAGKRRQGPSGPGHGSLHHMAWQVSQRGRHLGHTLCSEQTWGWHPHSKPVLACRCQQGHNWPSPGTTAMFTRDTQAWGSNSARTVWEALQNRAVVTKWALPSSAIWSGTPQNKEEASSTEENVPEPAVLKQPLESILGHNGV